MYNIRKEVGTCSKMAPWTASESYTGNRGHWDIREQFRSKDGQGSRKQLPVATAAEKPVQVQVKRKPLPWEWWSWRGSIDRGEAQENTQDPYSLENEVLEEWD